MGRVMARSPRPSSRSAAAKVSTPVIASVRAGQCAHAPALVGEVLRSSGTPLEPSVARLMRSRLGHDFSQVRIHTDSRADASAQALGALAYTVGSAIVFGRDHYAPGREQGRSLLAHELVHTVQQRATWSPRPDSQLRVAPDSGALETEARRAANAVRQGKDAPIRAQSPPSGPVVMRAPAGKSARPGTLRIYVRIDHAVSGEEFKIEALTQLFGGDRAMAMKRVAGWWFKGTPGEVGVHGTFPQLVPFTVNIGTLSADQTQAMEARRATIDPTDRAATYAAVDTEFEKRTGHGMLGASAADAAARSLWLQLLDDRLQKNEIRGKVQQALSSPKMKAFMSSASPINGRRRERALDPGEAQTLLAVAAEVEQMSDADLARYQRVQTGQAATWAESLTGVRGFVAGQAREGEVKDALAGDAGLIALIARDEELKLEMVKLQMAAGVNAIKPMLALIREEQQTATDLGLALHARGFADRQEYEDTVAAPWRDTFRVRALELARSAVDRAQAAAGGMREVLKHPVQADALFSTLQAIRSSHADITALPDVLAAYPALGYPKARDVAMRYDDVENFKWHLGSFLLNMEVGCMRIKQRLEREPDRVFEMDAIVTAALAEMHVDAGSPQAEALALGLGEHHDRGFWSDLADVIDFIEYFIPGLGEVKAIGNFLGEVNTHELDMMESTTAVRTTDPSTAGVWLSGIGAVAPFAAPPVLSRAGALTRRAISSGSRFTRELALAGKLKLAAPIARGLDEALPHIPGGRALSDPIELKVPPAESRLPLDPATTPDPPAADVAPTPASPSAEPGTGDAPGASTMPREMVTMTEQPNAVVAKPPAPPKLFKAAQQMIAEFRRQVPGVVIGSRRRAGVELINKLSAADRRTLIDALAAMDREQAGELLARIGRFESAEEMMDFVRGGEAEGAGHAPMETSLRDETSSAPEVGAMRVETRVTRRVTEARVQAGRSALRKAMKAAPPAWAHGNPDAWEAHHIIPVELQDHWVFDVLRTTEEGWDHNARVNGIALPATPEAASEARLPPHQVTRQVLEGARARHGSSAPIPAGVVKDLRGHPNVNRDIKAELDALEPFIDDPAKLRQKVLGIIDNERNRLLGDPESEKPRPPLQ